MKTMIKGKKNWLFCTIFLIICFVGWTLSFILSLVIPIPEGVLPESVNYRPELGDIIGIIVLLAFILAIIIYLFIIRFKGNKFKYSITITTKELILAIPQNNKDRFLVKDIKSYEIIEKRKNNAKLYIIINNIQLAIYTRRYYELKNILDFLIAQQNDEQNIF